MTADARTAADLAGSLMVHEDLVKFHLCGEARPKPFRGDRFIARLRCNGELVGDASRLRLSQIGPICERCVAAERRALLDRTITITPPPAQTVGGGQTKGASSCRT